LAPLLQLNNVILCPAENSRITFVLNKDKNIIGIELYLIVSVLWGNNIRRENIKQEWRGYSTLGQASILLSSGTRISAALAGKRSIT